MTGGWRCEFDSRVVERRPETPTSTVNLLDRLGCRWCLLRDVADDGRGDIEFDVLVDGEPRDVHRALVSLGAHRLASWGRSPHRQYTWWDPALRRVVRLDLVDQLAYGPERELRVDARGAVLDAAVDRDGARRPSPSNEQWLGLLHGLLDRGALRPRDLERLEPWVGDDDDVVVRALTDSTRRGLVESIHSRDWAAVQSQRVAVMAELRRGQSTASGVRRAWRRAIRRTTKLQRALVRPGVRVAVLGPDGAGKSTTIEALIRSGVVASSVYLGVAPAHERRDSVVPGVALARTIRRLLRAWLIAAARRRRGQTVALDRHPLEATIGPPTSKRTTLVRRWILAHLLPRPEVVVVLTAPAATLRERKPEHDPDDHLARRERYLELAQRRRYPIVDTTEAPEDVVAEIARIIHARRWKRRTP